MGSDSPPHVDVGGPSCLQDLVRPLQTFIDGAVDVPLGEELGGSYKDGHFLGSSSNLPTARGSPFSAFLFEEHHSGKTPRLTVNVMMYECYGLNNIPPKKIC